MEKTLIFEGAGMDWKETGLNHRIRTRIKNNDGAHSDGYSCDTLELIDKALAKAEGKTQ